MKKSPKSNHPKKTAELDEEAWAAWIGIEPKKSAPKPPKSTQGMQYRHAKRPNPKPTSHKMQSPVPAADLRGRPPQPSAPQRAATEIKGQGAAQPPPAISIQIRLPAFHLPRPHIPWRLMRRWTAGIAAVVLVVFGGKFAVDHLPKHVQKQADIPVNAQATADLGYKPLVPAARAAGEASPSEPVYNSKRQLYTYNDQYKGANLTVDQQAIPKKLKGKQTEIAKLAAAINAKDSFTTTLGKVYIFTSEDSGSQRLMLANDKMLLFIQSTRQVDTASWVEYIQSLQ